MNTITEDINQLIRRRLQEVRPTLLDIKTKFISVGRHPIDRMMEKDRFGDWVSSDPENVKKLILGMLRESEVCGINPDNHIFRRAISRQTGDVVHFVTFDNQKNNQIMVRTVVTEQQADDMLANAWHKYIRQGGGS